MSTPPTTAGSLLISYLVLRKAVGLLGLSLPFVLAFGGILLQGAGIQSSISNYYYTAMRNVFVGVLCAIGVFLFSYRGYERQDELAGDLACIFAVGVALFPTSPPSTPSQTDKLVSAFHHGFAAAFFLTLSYFSLVLFTKTDPTKRPTLRKLQRNTVYKSCGYTMLGAMTLIVVDALLPERVANQLEALDPVFWLESVAVVAFGISWLTKGEAILKDVEGTGA